MNAQAEEASKVFDVIKHVFAVLIVISGISGFYYLADHPGMALLYRVLILVFLLMVAVGVVYTTEVGKKVWSFFIESRQEVRRVVWPSRDETLRTTLLVFGMVFIVGMILWLLDMFLFWGVRHLTGQG